MVKIKVLKIWRKIRQSALNTIKMAMIALSPKAFNLLYYRLKIGRKCRLRPPVSFSEKSVWLKLNWMDPGAALHADKIEARAIVEKCGYAGTLIPLIGVYDSESDVDFAALPQRFAIKAAHSSGMYIICRDKNALDPKAFRKELRSWMKCNYFYRNAEYHYKGLKARIICEELLEDSEQTVSLRDYKIMCFNGEPRFIMVYANRGIKSAETSCYDADWNLLPVCSGIYSRSAKAEARPAHLDFMLQIARDFSAPFPFLRVDLYEVGGKVYFGEFTFFHNAGFCKFNPVEYDDIFGSMLRLPEICTDKKITNSAE